MSSRTERNASQALLARLEELADEGAAYRQAVAEKLGLNLTDYDAVRLLARAGAQPAGRLATLLNLTTGAVTGVLDRLERAGLASRGKDPEDRRQVIVEAAPALMESLESVLRPSRQALLELFGPRSPEELALLEDLLGKTAALLRAETTRLRGAGPGGGESFSRPLRGIKSARLRFTAGASRLSVRGGAPEGELFGARFEGREPQVSGEGGDVQVKYPRFSLLDWRRVSAELSLSEVVPWSIEIRGGASRLSAELESLQLSGFELTGGASDVSLQLPRPQGTVELRITGGASRVELRRPPGIPVQVRILGGVSKLSLDEQRVGAVGGASVLQTGAFETARDRYELRITGGASQISVG